MRVLNLIRKKKGMQILLRSTARTDLSLKLWRMKMINLANFPLAPPTAKVMATVYDKCLVNMEKTLIYEWKMWTKICCLILTVVSDIQDRSEDISTVDNVNKKLCEFKEGSWALWGRRKIKVTQDVNVTERRTWSGI